MFFLVKLWEMGNVVEFFDLQLKSWQRIFHAEIAMEVKREKGRGREREREREKGKDNENAQWI